VPSIVGGTNVYTVNVSDTFGNQITSGTRTFEVPSDLTLRDANNASDIIDDPNVTATVRFFEEGGERVFPRTPTNGVVDMSGLPVDQDFIVGVRDDSNTYVSRLTLIPTIFEQQDVYLIETTESTAIVRISVEDRTGLFSNEGTRIRISRAINTTDSPPNEEEYVIVAGDVIGGQLTFETELQQDVRYRVSIENGQGDVRQLGRFTARVDQLVELTVTGLNVGFDDSDTGVQIQTSGEIVNDTTKTFQFTMLDLSEKTTNIEVKLVEIGNKTNVVDEGSTAGPVGSFQFTRTVTGDNADKEWIFQYSYDRDGETVTGEVIPGQDSFPLLTDLDDGWATIFGVGLIIVIGGLFSVANVKVGVIVIPAIAAFLFITGILSTAMTGLSIGIAFALGIGYNVIRSTRGLQR